MALVLPAPAPASTQTGPRVASATSRCSGSSAASTASGPSSSGRYVSTAPPLAIRFAILPHPTDAPGKPGDANGVASAELVWDGKETRVSEPVVMYTTPWCGFCRRLKKQLEREGIEVSEVDIERDPAAADYVMSVNGGNQTVPTVVFPDGTALTNPSAAQVREHLRDLTTR